MINLEASLLDSLNIYVQVRMTQIEADIVVARATHDLRAYDRAHGAVTELKALCDWLAGEERAR